MLYLILSSALLFLPACQSYIKPGETPNALSQNSPSRHPSQVQGPNDGPTLDDDARTQLAKFDIRQEMNSIDYVKFVVFLDANQKPKSILFQNTNKFAFHSDYLLTRSEFQGWTRSKIDDISIKPGPNRRLLIGTLFSHNFDDPVMAAKFEFTFELVSQQLEPVATVSAVRKLISESSPKSMTAAKLGYLASGPQRSQILGQGPELAAAGIQTYDPYQSKTMQVYVQGWNVGTILIAKADELEHLLAQGQIRRDHILVLDKVPREIPPVAGLITAEPTASSSHVHLLAEMFGIPLIYQKNILEKAQDLNGKVVALKAGPHAIEYLQAIPQNIATRLAEAKKYPPVNIAADFSKTQIMPTTDLKESDLNAYGGKSVRMGLLRRTIPQNTASHAAAIPIYYFQRFLTEARGPNGASLAAYVQPRLQQLETRQMNFGESISILQEIREAMHAAKIPAPLLNDIRAALVKQFPQPNQRLKLRSSSNVEDGAEFNGAGLYDSEGIWLSNPPPGKEDDFEKGLNKVWRSLYSDRGFLARQVFGIKESKAAMGILAHPPFKGEVANGVVIVKPKSRFSAQLVTATGFPGEDSSVTNPNSSDLPEIMQIEQRGDGSTWRTQLVQGCSQLPAGRTLMNNNERSDNEYYELANLAMKVTKAFPGGIPSQGLDFEWKLMEEGSRRWVVLKQVRPLPKPRKDNYSDGSKFFFLGDRQQKYEIGYPEQNGAYGQFFCPEKLSVTMPSFSEQDLKKSLKLPLLEFELRGEKYSYQNLPVKALPVQDPAQENQFKFLVVAKSKFSDFHEFTFEPNIFSSTRTSSLLTDLKGTVGGPKKELKVTEGIFPSVTNYSCAFGIYDFVPSKALPPNYLNLTYKVGATGKLTYEGVYQPLSGYDKTAHFIITKATLEGFSQNPIVVDVIRGATYAAEHHNFSWGFALDVEAAKLSEAEKSQVYNTHGRFLLLGEKAAWLKNGRLGKMMDATLQNQKH